MDNSQWTLLCSNLGMKRAGINLESLSRRAKLVKTSQFKVCHIYWLSIKKSCLTSISFKVGSCLLQKIQIKILPVNPRLSQLNSNVIGVSRPFLVREPSRTIKWVAKKSLNKRRKNYLDVRSAKEVSRAKTISTVISKLNTSEEGLLPFQRITRESSLLSVKILKAVITVLSAVKMLTQKNFYSHQFRWF